MGVAADPAWGPPLADSMQDGDPGRAGLEDRAGGRGMESR